MSKIILGVATSALMFVTATGLMACSSSSSEEPNDQASGALVSTGSGSSATCTPETDSECEKCTARSCCPQMTAVQSNIGAQALMACTDDCPEAKASDTPSVQRRAACVAACKQDASYDAVTAYSALDACLTAECHGVGLCSGY